MHWRRIPALSSRRAFHSVRFSVAESFIERLQERKDNEWGDYVHLLFGDMRTVKVPEQVDILISELLGSFGDNELSPECLDGAVRFLKRMCLLPHPISP
jgi:hypothetical protein